MENCLVTKLKGIVNNSELETLNTLRFYVGVSSTSLHSGNVLQIGIKNEEACIITVEAPSYFTNSEGTINNGTSVNVPANTLVSASVCHNPATINNEVVCVCHITKKSTLNMIQTNTTGCFGDAKPSELAYTRINQQQFPLGGKYYTALNFGSKGTLENLYLGASSRYLSYGRNFYTCITNASNYPFKKIVMSNTYSNAPITTFSGFTSLENLICKDNNSTIKGKIEELVQGQRLNKRNNGQITIVSCMSNDNPLTFNDVNVANGTHTLSWTADTITVDDVTINA